MTDCKCAAIAHLTGDVCFFCQQQAATDLPACYRTDGKGIAHYVDASHFGGDDATLHVVAAIAGWTPLYERDGKEE